MIARELLLARELRPRRRSGLAQMNPTGLVVADRAVPAIAIAGDPSVNLGGEPADSRHQHDPREEIPTREKQPDPSPGIGAFIGPAPSIHGYHPAHRFLTIDLRETPQSG